MVPFELGVKHNYVVNSAMTHLPQVKGIRSDIIKLGLLLLNSLLHTTTIRLA
jgi:hypothetical protein